MGDKAMDTYLNDHLAGATLGSDLARQIEAHSVGTALGGLMASLAPEIEEDRQTLIGLMQRIGSSRSPVKQAGAVGGREGKSGEVLGPDLGRA